MPVGSAPIEEVERKNVVIVNPNQQIKFMPRHEIEVDHSRNCYS